MLASMDILGIVHIRCIADLAEAETILYTINSIPKEMDNFARVFFNNQKLGSEAEILVLINDVLMALDIQGRQIDSTVIRDEHTLLKVDNSSILDNDFIYQMLCKDLQIFINENC